MIRSPLLRQRPVIITGTPFAGSSIVGEILASSGLFVGDDLPLPLHDDFSGLASDREIAGLHDRLLEAVGTRWDDCLALDPLPVSQEDREACGELLERKFVAHDHWGWTDPRTVLLLEHWESVLPEATWVFVVRPPEASVWAMIDRPVRQAGASTDERREESLVRLWSAYAQRIARFAARNPQRTLLVSTPHDLFPVHQAALAERLAASTGTAVTKATVAKIYDPLLMRIETPPAIAEQAASDEVERARAALTELGMSLAMEPRPPKLPDRGPTDPARRLCVTSFSRCAYSETFIRAQLNRLPAEVLHLWGRPGAIKRTQDGIAIDGGTTGTAAPPRVPSAVASSGHSTEQVVRCLRQHRIEAVLAQYGAGAVEYIEPCRELGIPLIPHFHGFDAYMQEVLENHRIDYPELFEFAAAIVVVSNDMARQLVTLGAPPEKIHNIPCGVDPDRFGGADPLGAPPTFLAVGRFVAKKGPQLTLLAFSQVLEQRPDARLVMIGEGVLKSPCIHLARAMGIEAAVRFEGARSHSEVVRRMQEVRAFVQHSIRQENGDSEGTPVAVMEAGAAGLPVVATAHAGIADVVVDGETGFLVDEADTTRMAERMLALIDDPSLAARLGEGARRRIRAEYTLDGAIVRLWDVIQEAISSTGRSRPGA